MVNGSESRCCQPRHFPLIWEDYSDQSHPQRITLDEWLASLPPFALAHEQGAIEDLFAAAALGELEDTGDYATPITPVRTEPEVFELRLTCLSKKLRFYHGEPPAEKDKLIELHRHIKINKPDQDAAIQHAGEQFNLWYSQ